MKPVPIDCGNGCKTCDGYGVMTLYNGTPDGIIAPCLMCSPSELLDDCLARREGAEKQVALAEEKRLIQQHNERLATSAGGR